jgi:glycerol-3-phosphate acyltransferase PlsY
MWQYYQIAERQGRSGSPGHTKSHQVSQVTCRAAIMLFLLEFLDCRWSIFGNGYVLQAKTLNKSIVLALCHCVTPFLSFCRIAAIAMRLSIMLFSKWFTCLSLSVISFFGLYLRYLISYFCLFCAFPKLSTQTPPRNKARFPHLSIVPFPLSFSFHLRYTLLYHVHIW